MVKKQNNNLFILMNIIMYYNYYSFLQ